MRFVLADQKIQIGTFVDLVASTEPHLKPGAGLERRLKAEHEIVLKQANSDQPIYGLNTALGANLGHRIDPSRIREFQKQIIRGRAFAVGEPLPGPLVRGSLLARIVSASHGGSGMSLPLFLRLIEWFESGAVPTVPSMGSIGASDLTQNAHIGLCIIGEGTVEGPSGPVPTSQFLDQSGLAAHDPNPKDAMALINHSGLTVSFAGHAIVDAITSIAAARSAALLAIVGYQANPAIFSQSVNAMRLSPDQAETAGWFERSLKGCRFEPRRIQEALSFRTVAPILGASNALASRAAEIWEHEANGLSDSPVVLPDGTLQSTPNFVAPGLAFAMENISLSVGHMAAAANQRVQKLMLPELSGLPKYLSPTGGAAAGFVPLQKTTAALLSDILQGAQPVTHSLPPVSETVEDIAPTTPQSALKLMDQLKDFRRLVAIEALVACQAIDLRKPDSSNPKLERLHDQIRQLVPFRNEDCAIDLSDQSLSSIVDVLADAGRLG